MKNRLLLVLFFLFCYNLFFFNIRWGIAFGVFVTLVNILLFINRKPTNLFAPFFAILSIFCSFLFSYTSNGFVQFLDFIAVFFYLSLSLLFYGFEKPQLLTTSTLLIGPLTLFNEYFINTLKVIKSVFTIKKEIPGFPIKAIIRGIIITIPIFLVLYLLLSSADPIFSSLSGNFLNNAIFRESLPRIIISSILGLLFLSLLTLWITGGIFYPTTLVKKLPVFLNEITILLVSIFVLFAGFILVQFRYLFNSVSEIELHKFGIATYSEYVTKGFGELIVVSFIAYLIIFLAVRMNEMKTHTVNIVVHWLTMGVMAEVFALILSNAQRVHLYVGSHGLTRIRVFGLFFLLWLSFMLLSLLIKSFTSYKTRFMTTIEVLVTFVVLLTMNMINVDRMIAIQFPPTVNREVDYYYISRLSYDGVEGWLPAVSDAKKTIEELSNKTVINTEDNRRLYYAQITLGELSYQIDNLRKYDDKNYPWQAINFSEKNANAFISQYPEFQEIKTLNAKATKLKKSVSQDVRDKTNYDRSSNHEFINR